MFKAGSLAEYPLCPLQDQASISLLSRLCHGLESRICRFPLPKQGPNRGLTQKIEQAGRRIFGTSREGSLQLELGSGEIGGNRHDVGVAYSAQVRNEL